MSAEPAATSEPLTAAGQQKKCWCGNDTLIPFGPSYLRCERCETLVACVSAGSEISVVKNDEQDLYGRKYWFEHQEGDLGFPTIVERSRTDLPERCLFWLRALLKYKLPPARVLEIACAHGGFVALMRQAGFDAAGLELSPSIVEFARKTFDVPVLLGPIESQDIPLASLDVIVMMDVLEHLPDPKSSLGRCRELLKPDGILMIQTPSYREGKSYEQMTAENDYFLNHMRGKAEKEHLFLYSPKSVRELLKGAGFEHVQFEPAIFAAYDMFLVASAAPLNSLDVKAADAALASTASGRMTQALIDLDARAQKDYGELLAERDKLRADLAACDAELAQLREAVDAIRGSRAFGLLRRFGFWSEIEKRPAQAQPDCSK
ncbi:MAG TPA: class I SAM-dependent methyltransferase [Planctomycetota bacterium]|nr:class I SAM-dependent methyltransferase [Planctomycetota bacterium]